MSVIFCSDKRTRLRQGKYSCIVFHQNLLYAAATVCIEVHVFSYEQAALVCTRTIKLIRFKANPFGDRITLCAKKDRLTCSTIHTIHAYSLSGEFLNDNSSLGIAMWPRHPRICDVDSAGSVLIAEYNSHRLAVISEQGEFGVLDLQPKISFPASAVMFNGYLYVTSLKKAVHKYSCPSSQAVLHFKY